MNTNIPVSEVPGGGGVHGGHIQPTDYIWSHRMYFLNVSSSMTE